MDSLSLGKLCPPGGGLKVQIFSLSIVIHMLLKHKVWKVNMRVTAVTSTPTCSYLLLFAEAFFPLLHFSAVHSHGK